MRCVSILALVLALLPTASAAQPYPSTADPYVVAGQDLAGYRIWVAADLAHSAALSAYATYLRQAGVGDVVPVWQLVRTASDWAKCGQTPFEVPPPELWPNIVNTLRYVQSEVKPAVGEVEAVSVYRNPMLNQCAKGSPRSAHQLNYGVDLVPRYPFERRELMSRLCTVHARSGLRYGAGLGFYVGIRFHIDVWKYRNWGVSAEEGGDQCAIALERREAARPSEHDD
ncbi:MAG: hypothetical protein V4491_01645 [Pseudomonadota bacterium]